ncbi:[3-methyl-2-oxobutanoate dehydrogenase [lipoamide]] kinase, mitochondrial [Zancudomyces culisetae]|uniref:Protein-serine/threonine kinase n=1 Tax=Zancudomyces culisetae TaxID=1213189 RepID=A0A1R1PFS1_ZANCU|nr:[3-methyl-2-oxobutanoate dehydrogenase [lipoamide]] kinase, mitochondrial [Zancudomyces culisetae]|eukprot:OMH79796.1 [3-methyl-2-oxobutanoate dehydrogenase [lipoamide]] kinase, mitochondrial [Zancudomyces culisetae]
MIKSHKSIATKLCRTIKPVVGARNFITISIENLPKKFYTNNILEEYTRKQIKKVTVRQLVHYGRSITEAKLLASANYVRTELPVRLAHRIKDFQFMPFICGNNSHLIQVYNLYWKAFDDFRKAPEIKTVEDVVSYCKFVQESVNEHYKVIPHLVVGIAECVGLVEPALIERFASSMLMTRISRRTLAEQQVALTNKFIELGGGATNKNNNIANNTGNDGDKEQTRIGIVDTSCNISNLIQNCAVKVQRSFEKAYNMQQEFAPRVIIEGSVDTTIMCIPEYVDYIMYAIIKNAMGVTIKKGLKNNTQSNSQSNLQSNSQFNFDPIIVTVCSTKTDITIRISDSGGGMENDMLSQVWLFGSPLKVNLLSNFESVKTKQAKVDEEVNISPLTSFGFGLPMSRTFAKYWGGDITIHSLPGYGVDVYVTLPKLGNVAEHLTDEDSEEGFE